jgi:hypothetical protein
MFVKNRQPKNVSYVNASRLLNGTTRLNPANYGQGNRTIRSLSVETDAKF